ncbi:MAG: MgtC/SapB family protein [Bacteroidales bacterium]|nr:MgtC/SapB family protein [Bacteroidales bacterium]
MELKIFFLRLASALAAGIIIGIERQMRQRSAGLATNSLVSVGACIFILISETVIGNAVASGSSVNNDNLRVLSQVVAGVGFLGAGAIIKEGFNIHGLNSAATIWCAAAVGCLCGFGYWKMALVATSVIIFINWVLKSIEIMMEKKDREKKKIEEEKRSLMNGGQHYGKD